MHTHANIDIVHLILSIIAASLVSLFTTLTWTTLGPHHDILLSKSTLCWVRTSATFAAIYALLSVPKTVLSFSNHKSGDIQPAHDFSQSSGYEQLDVFASLFMYVALSTLVYQQLDLALTFEQHYVRWEKAIRRVTFGLVVICITLAVDNLALTEYYYGGMNMTYWKAAQATKGTIDVVLFMLSAPAGFFSLRIALENKIIYPVTSYLLGLSGVFIITRHTYALIHAILWKFLPISDVWIPVPYALGIMDVCAHDFAIVGSIALTWMMVRREGKTEVQEIT